MSRKSGWEKAFAVVRVDDRTASCASPKEDGPSIEIGEFSVTVKEVVRTSDAAKAECLRLNSLNVEKGCRYYWQGTRYFSAGGSFGSDGAE